MEKNPLKIYFQYSFRGELIHFNTQYGVQNAKKIDTASELALNKIKLGSASRIFIANAGYGQIGIPLAKTNSGVTFELTDRDFVNVALIKENAISNHCQNIIAYLSDGLEQARSQSYDLIFLNYHHQFGKEWFEHFLVRAGELLSNEGKMVILIHKSLKEFAKRLVEEKFGQYKKIYHDNSHYLLSN